MNNKFSILSNIPGFSGLSGDQLKKLNQIAVEKKYLKGRAIFTEGDVGNGFYIVVEGRVKIFKVSSKGKEHILRIVRPKETFGQVAVYSGRSFPASSEAISNCDLFLIPNLDKPEPKRF